MLQGPPTQVPAFIGFIKREISRRWGHRPDVGWHGTMWHEYLATALPTPDSEVHCLKYVLSQGVKEGLVARPEDWPGVHCARSLATGAPLTGAWLNATDYGRAVDREARKVRPKPIAKEDFLTAYDVNFAPIPCWAHLDELARQGEVKRLIEEIVAEGEASRAGAPPLGERRIRGVSLEHRTSVPPPPWWTRRRRMLCWALPSAAATRCFLRAYWTFQARFREAAIEDARQRGAVYPEGAFIPGRWKTSTPAPTAQSA